MQRRWMLAAMVCLVAGSFPATSGASAHGYVYDGPVPLPADGAWFGAHVAVDDRTGPDRQSALLSVEEQIGRQFGLERVFYRWDEEFPTADDRWSRDRGRVLLLSWNASSNDLSVARWADIAAGKYDDVIDARADAIKAFGSPLIFAFHHEPGNRPPGGESAGSPEDYVAATRHIHDRFEARGVENVTWALVLFASEYGNSERVASWYAGDEYIDILAADGYNWYGCNGRSNAPWRSVEAVFRNFYEYGLAHRKPMIVAEWASGEDPEVVGRKAQWIEQGAEIFQSWPEIVGVSWFNAAPNPGCPRWVDTSSSSLAAFRAMGELPYFGGEPPAGPITTITHGPPANTSSSTAEFRFTSDPEVSSFRCSVDSAPAEPCASPYVVSGLASGPHEFKVHAVAEEPGSQASWSWSISGVSTSQINVWDFGYTPSKVEVPLGQPVEWVIGPTSSTHRVVDQSGLGLFDSGDLAPGQSFTHTFTAAGTYRYGSPTYRMYGSIRVPVAILQSSEDPSTSFTVRWASENPSGGRTYDVLVRRPGQQWEPWRVGETATEARFVVDGGQGDYAFRARLRDPSLPAASYFSPPRSITVG